MPELDPQAIKTWLEGEPGGQFAAGNGIANDDLVSVSPLLRRLGEALDAAELGPRFAKQPALDALLELAPHLSTGRRLRILTWIGEQTGAHGGQILTALLSDTNLIGDVLRSEVQHLHRAARLEAIFSTDRLKRVLAACEKGIPA